MLEQNFRGIAMRNEEISNKTKNSAEKGFTLVELMVVVVLLGLIMTVVAKGIFSKGAAAKAELNVTRMESLKQEISRYRLMYNSYPTSIEDLIRPNSQIKQSGKLFTPILKEDELQDMWGNKYIYKQENDGRSYSLTSFGSDGVAGGEGADQDITSRP